MIFIFPADPSTKFLAPIVREIENITSVTVYKADPGTYEETVDHFVRENPATTVVFLGHGNHLGLYGGCYVPEGKLTLISQEQAVSVLKSRKLICLSCKSVEFLSSIPGTIDAAIGFGHIITGKEDLIGQKQKKKFRDLTPVEAFKERFTIIVAKALLIAYQKKYSFLELYYLLRLKINKEINQCSLAKNENDKLVGELLFDFKSGMQLIGNPGAPVSF